MINIFAQTFMIATRTKTSNDVFALPPVSQAKRRWLPEGHWWLQKD